MGYFLERAGRDYVIFERDSSAGRECCIISVIDSYKERSLFHFSISPSLGTMFLNYN